MQKINDNWNAFSRRAHHSERTGNAICQWSNTLALNVNKTFDPESQVYQNEFKVIELDHYRSQKLTVPIKTKCVLPVKPSSLCHPAMKSETRIVYATHWKNIFLHAHYYLDHDSYMNVGMTLMMVVPRGNCETSLVRSPLHRTCSLAHFPLTFIESTISTICTAGAFVCMRARCEWVHMIENGCALLLSRELKR